jgi:hypothetical protein
VSGLEQLEIENEKLRKIIEKTAEKLNLVSVKLKLRQS